MIDTLKPGTTIRCTITKSPSNAGGRKTLERLMRLEPAIAKGLRRAHHKRQQNLEVYNRGNRDWTKRVPCGKFVQPIKGQAWSMKFTAPLAADLKSIESFIKVEKA